MLENSIKDVLNSEIITSDMIPLVADALDALRACVTTSVTAAKRNIRIFARGARQMRVLRELPILLPVTNLDNNSLSKRKRTESGDDAGKALKGSSHRPQKNQKKFTESDKDLETVTSDLEPEQLAESTQRPTIVRPPIAIVVESELAVKQAVDKCIETLLRKLERFELLAENLGFQNDRRVYTEQNQLLVYRIRFFNDSAKSEGFEDARQKYIAYIWKVDRPTWEEEDLNVTEVYDCDSCMHAQCCEWV